MKTLKQSIQFLSLATLIAIFIFNVLAYTNVHATVLPGVSVIDLQVDAINYEVGEEITGLFTVRNVEDEVIPDLIIKYQLFVADEKGVPQGIIDEVKNENFILSPNEDRMMDFSYTIPQNLLEGNYGFRIEVGNIKGLPLGWNDRSISIIGSDSFVYLVDRSLFIDGKETHPTSGADIHANDVPIRVEFNAVNKGNTKIDGTVKLNVYRMDNTYPVLRGFISDPVSLAIGSEQKIIFDIGMFDRPDGYLAEGRFYDNNNQPISNVISFRFDLEGPSATITQIRSDKEGYLAGENAEVVVGIATLDDPLSKEKANLSVSIVNADTNKVIGESSFLVSLAEGGGDQKFNIKIQEDAENIKILSSIQKGNTTLDSYDVFLSEEAKIAGEGALEGARQQDRILYLVGLLIFIIVALIMFKNYRGKISLLLVLIILFSGSLFWFSSSDVHACEGLGMRLAQVEVIGVGKTITAGKGVYDTSLSWNLPYKNQEFSVGNQIIFNGRLAITSCRLTLVNNTITFYLADENGNNRANLGTVSLANFDFPKGLTTSALEYRETFIVPDKTFLSGKTRAYIDFKGHRPGAVHTMIAYDFVYINKILTLTTAKSGIGSGTIASSPSGINCGLDCSEEYESGGYGDNPAIVTLTAIPQPGGSSFAGWSGSGCSGTGTCTVPMTQDRNVTAAFDIAPYVSLSANPSAIEYGEASTLTWTSANVTSCIADIAWSGVKALLGSENTDTLFSDKVYGLTCSGIYGSSKDTTTVFVAAPNQCEDGLDNNNNGLIDANDPGCWGSCSDSNTYDRDDNDEGNYQCSDCVDNDGDRRIDYPKDTSCLSASGDNESIPVCGNTVCESGEDASNCMIDCVTINFEEF